MVRRRCKNMTSCRVKSLQETLTRLVAERDALITSFPLTRPDGLVPPSLISTPSPTSTASSARSRATISFGNDDVIMLAHKIVKRHIALLGRYNEVRDIGQGLLGMIADQRGIRIVDVMEEFGVVGKE